MEVFVSQKLKIFVDADHDMGAKRKINHIDKIYVCQFWGLKLKYSRLSDYVNPLRACFVFILCYMAVVSVYRFWISNLVSAYFIDNSADMFVPLTPALANLFAAIGTDKFDDDDEGYTYFNIKYFKGKTLTLDVQSLEFKIQLNDLSQDEKVVYGTTYVAIDQYSVDIGINVDAGTLLGFLPKEWHTVWDYDNHQMHFDKYKPEDIVEVPSDYEFLAGTKDVPEPTNTYTAI